MSDPETEITGLKMKDHLKKANIKEKLNEKINGERWHGQLRQARWQEQHVRSGWMLCLAVARDLRSYPDHCWGLLGLYEQLTPTIKKVYTVHNTGTTQGNVSCRMFGKSPETQDCSHAIGVLCFGPV